MQSNQVVLCPSDILTPKELAARLKVSTGWIYEKMHRTDSSRAVLSLLQARIRFD